MFKQPTTSERERDNAEPLAFTTSAGTVYQFGTRDVCSNRNPWTTEPARNETPQPLAVAVSEYMQTVLRLRRLKPEQPFFGN
jgi:hypothetical protein